MFSPHDTKRAAGQARSAVATPDGAAGRSILVVDDDPSVRDSLRVLLETLGFDVRTHASGGELLGDAARRDAGCFILDHHMPGMDGLETLSALRGEGCTVPAILITGRIGPDTTARAGSFGVLAVLEKPFSAVRLLEVVRVATGKVE